MTADEVVAELATLGSETIKKTLMKHGAKEPFYGVKIEDLKKIQKRVKKNHELALALYDTGISDAMYLAGLIAEPAKMTKGDLERWVQAAYWHMLSDYTVAWVAAESMYPVAMATKWIDSKKDLVASAGWSTMSSLVSITPDEDLDLDLIERLLTRVEEKIHAAPNRTRYSMNGFVIAVGGYVEPLAERAKAAARKVGTVDVEMGGTACKVPQALEYIEKVEQRGRRGKRKSAMC
jgi:3-methyladenine DNA glycosylase AlkD